MAFTINTNIASLQAQDYLNQTQTFQNQTINEVTSGLRIVNSGDDPSGLAIANSYRSNEAVLTQGIANANDGLSQLQIADGGISNISQLLDSARTLATEAASDTFTGDRGVLNNQFQSVLTEINRQAQAIGLNQGGTFAKALNVFIGGGEASGTITATQNGTVSVNLSQSTVDSKSLGLEGVVATGVNSAGTTDLGPGSATSVSAIVTNGSQSVIGFQQHHQLHLHRPRLYQRRRQRQGGRRGQSDTASPTPALWSPPLTRPSERGQRLHPAGHGVRECQHHRFHHHRCGRAADVGLQLGNHCVPGARSGSGFDRAFGQLLERRGG